MEGHRVQEVWWERDTRRTPEWIDNQGELGVDQPIFSAYETVLVTLLNDRVVPDMDSKFDVLTRDG